MRFVTFIVLSLVLIGCTKKNQKVDPDPDEITHSSPAAEPPDPGPAAPADAADLDFSTPEAAVNTFIRGAAKKDIDILSQCFSSDAEKEFAGILEKDASEKDLVELEQMFGRASVTETVMKAGGTSAAVKVKLEWEGRPDETLNVVKEGSGWKIQGF
ncbi:MAG: hypothetical protein ABIJ56_15620 [Pseudomonadota bacterium]